jgi:glycosyltransferase involved in cell wall biosynthesis
VLVESVAVKSIPVIRHAPVSEGLFQRRLTVGEPADNKAINLERNSLLIISYLFPPAGGIAVQRSLCLAKYLSAADYDVHVLKATTAGPVYDFELTRTIPASVHVHEAFTPEIPFALRHTLWSKLAGPRQTEARDAGAPAAKPKRNLIKGLVVGAVKRMLCPEPEILWVPFALRKARRIVQQHRIKYVLVTVPPFSALIVGTALKREFPSITLVSDFRDEWLSFYLKDFEFQNSDYTRLRAEAIERDTVQASDLVVAVNHSSRDVIRRRYPDQPGNKFVTIPNGYDPDVFDAFKPRPSAQSRMLVTHV